ncbi:ferredoxin [Candidatus Woesearchaeota archaeon]|nr:ferredoxin [Candidatus Woesearchaeota archaeon]
MKVSVDKEKCIGCGACVAACEEVFELKAGKAAPKVQETDKECAKEAADVCPVEAIKAQ